MLEKLITRNILAPYYKKSVYALTESQGSYRFERDDECDGPPKKRVRPAALSSGTIPATAQSMTLSMQ
jgi:hypothetical protein